MNQSAFFNMSYGVYGITAWDSGRATGCIANSVMQITAEPPTFAVSMNRSNYTNLCIRKSGRFAISILTEKTDPKLIGVFGFRSGKDHDKFEEFDYILKEHMPVIADACAYITCEMSDIVETDTHTIFIGKVTDADNMKKETPMTYAYYHNVIKGKSPKSAPTYVEEERKEKITEKKEKDNVQYVCSVCGYVYDGDVPFEELPDSYICPLCTQPKSVFYARRD